MITEGADEDDTSLAIDGTIIKQVMETIFLRVTINDKLSWKPRKTQNFKKNKTFYSHFNVIEDGINQS